MYIFLTYFFLILGMSFISKIKIINTKFVRFVIVGIINTLNYAVVFELLLNYLEYSIAHILSFLVSAFISYFLTSMYTFNKRPQITSFLKFPLSFLPNLIGSTLITIILVENKVLSSSIASIIVMLFSIPVTFLINKFIFNKEK